MTGFEIAAGLYALAAAGAWYLLRHEPRRWLSALLWPVTGLLAIVLSIGMFFEAPTDEP